MIQDTLNELSVPGMLRVGINMRNGLLVTGKTPSGKPKGVHLTWQQRYLSGLEMLSRMCAILRLDCLPMQWNWMSGI